jgi:hypothetical protein
MFEKLKNNGLKISVFVINILLMAIAVLVIREKDQQRLLDESGKTSGSDSTSSESPAAASNEAASSFEGQINQSSEEVQSVQQDVVPAPADSPASQNQPAVNSVPTPVPAPAPSKPASTPNRKTKTS